MLAPGSGVCDSESITVPVTVLCEKAEMLPSKKTRSKNFLIRANIRFKFSVKIQPKIRT